MSEGVVLNPTRLVLAALIGLVILLVLIIKFNVQAMIAILIGAICIGLLAGMPTQDIISAVNDGIGNTLKGIALLVGLGSMFGAILEVSGGAQTIAVTMVKKFGDEKAGILRCRTDHSDPACVLTREEDKAFLPSLCYSASRRTCGRTCVHSADTGSGPCSDNAECRPRLGHLSRNLLRNLRDDRCRSGMGIHLRKEIFCSGSVANQEEIDESKLPSFGLIVGIILIPLVLIILDSICGVVPALAGVAPIFEFLGEPFVALLIATLAAMFGLGLRHGYTMKELEKVMTKSLEPTGLILLVTACGGVLRYVLQYSGLGDVIGNAVASMNLPIVVLAFIIAVLVRISVGSATVAMTMAAGIVAALPGISELSPLYLACTVAAVAGGATVCSHFNDSGFWLVRSLVGIDEKTTLKTWTIMETLVGGTGFIVALIISFFA